MIDGVRQVATVWWFFGLPEPWAGAQSIRLSGVDGKPRALGWSERLLKEIRNG